MENILDKDVYIKNLQNEIQFLNGRIARLKNENMALQKQLKVAHAVKPVGLLKHIYETLCSVYDFKMKMPVSTEEVLRAYNNFLAQQSPGWLAEEKLGRPATFQNVERRLRDLLLTGWAVMQKHGLMEYWIPIRRV